MLNEWSCRVTKCKTYILHKYFIPQSTTLYFLSSSLTSGRSFTGLKKYAIYYCYGSLQVSCSVFIAEKNNATTNNVLVFTVIFHL